MTEQELKILDEKIAKMQKEYNRLAIDLFNLRKLRVKNYGLPSVKVKKARKDYPWVRVYFTDDEYLILKKDAKTKKIPQSTLLKSSYFRDKSG